MKEEWYADKRDVVKWATVLHFCRNYNLSVVAYIAMLRDGIALPSLEVNGTAHPMCPEAWKHFRRIENIHNIGLIADIAVRLFDRPFKWTRCFPTQLAARADYFRRAAEFVQAEDRPVAVLVDADTGIAPQNVEWEHVTANDLATLFEVLKNGDVLISYQHQYRAEDWIEASRDAFANAVSLTPDRVQTVTSAYAGDVAFHAARKCINQGGDI